MEWVIVAEGTSPQNIQPTSIGVGKQIRHGAPFDVIVQTPSYLPVAPLFDALSSERMAGRIYQDTKAVLKDVEGVGFNTIVLHMESNAFVLTAGVLLALALIIFGAGFLILSIKIKAPEEFLENLADIPKDISETVKWITIGLIVIAIVVIVSMLKNTGFVEAVTKTVKGPARG